MNNMSRRSVIRGSAGSGGRERLGAAVYRQCGRPKTAVVWQVQGFVPQEDAAFRKTVADYEKASGNKIDLSVMPFQALNQKAVSALTSGDVPDLIFHDAPATILPQNAWDDKLVDVSDVVEAYKSKLSETALLNSTLLQRHHEAAQLLPGSGQAGATPFHIWGDLVEKAGFKLSDAPKTWDAFWEFLQAGAEGTARQGHAQDLCHGPADHHRRTERRQQSVRLFHGCQRRPGHRHPGRQAAHRRSEGARGGNQVGRIHDRTATRKATSRRRR